LRRPRDRLHLLGRAAVHRAVRGRLRPPGAALGVVRDRRRRAGGIMSLEPQILASDPDGSAFVTANAGTGKTWTLVARVARLLLRGADPAAILCVTYTKAAAAEMQGRLFAQLGEWAVSPDRELAEALAALEESPDDLARARRLFARALETPGGLKIQTIHAFCEMLLKRFPLEAGVSPTFQVLEEAEAQIVAAHARDSLATIAMDGPEGAVGRAYGHFSMVLHHRLFNEMFADFAARRGAIAAYAADPDWPADVWRRCGFGGPVDPEGLEQAAVDAIDWAGWRAAAEALQASGASGDVKRGRAMARLDTLAGFAAAWAVFANADGTAARSVCTKQVDAGVRAWLE